MRITMCSRIGYSYAKAHHDEIMTLRRNRDRAGLQELQDELIAETKATCMEMGKTLNFKGEIKENRDATEEEIQHLIKHLTGGCSGCGHHHGDGECGGCGDHHEHGDGCGCGHCH